MLVNIGKNRDKKNALAELAYIWFFADMKSPYLSIVDAEERQIEIIRDLDGIDEKKWKPDKLIKEAIDFYKKRDTSPIKKSYEAAMIASDAVNSTLIDAKNLIGASDDPIAATQKLVAALEKVPKIMDALSEANKRLIREIEDKEGRKKGSKELSMFEDGFNDI